RTARQLGMIQYSWSHIEAHSFQRDHRPRPTRGTARRKGRHEPGASCTGPTVKKDALTGNRNRAQTPERRMAVQTVGFPPWRNRQDRKRIAATTVAGPWLKAPPV